MSYNCMMLQRKRGAWDEFKGPYLTKRRREVVSIPVKYPKIQKLLFTLRPPLMDSMLGSFITASISIRSARVPHPDDYGLRMNSTAAEFPFQQCKYLYPPFSFTGLSPAARYAPGCERTIEL